MTITKMILPLRTLYRFTFNSLQSSMVTKILSVDLQLDGVVAVL
jgi:hypothetical protein